MKSLPFTKMHGTWNDFIVLHHEDLQESGIRLDESFVRKMCHRNFWIGSDGIVLVEKGDATGFKYTMYNPDGTQAEMCGNGIRCYMKYLTDKKLMDKTSIEVETGAGILGLQIETDMVTVNMGIPQKIQELTLGHENLWETFEIESGSRKFTFMPVSMGNPHAVIFLQSGELESFELDTYGKPIESNMDIFPKKTNVEFVETISPREIRMRVFERGAGETLACGTGACASVVAGISAWKLTKNEYIQVHLAGWTIEVRWSSKENDPVIMRGKAETVFEWRYFVE